MNRVSFPLAGFRLVRVGLLILSGVLTVGLIYPWIDDAARFRIKQRWSKTLLTILDVRLDADLGGDVSGRLLVANHISWLDIFVINAVFPSAFVAKAEVRQWPVLGWLAAMNDTVFLQRGRGGQAAVINHAIGQKLCSGKTVAVFPEGTTSDGRQVLKFHAALVQPALDLGRPVVPLALSYWQGGERSLAPRYDGAISLGACVLSIAGCRGLTARLQGLEALGCGGEDRRRTAAAAQAAIAAEIAGMG